MSLPCNPVIDLSFTKSQREPAPPDCASSSQSDSLDAARRKRALREADRPVAKANRMSERSRHGNTRGKWRR